MSVKLGPVWSGARTLHSVPQPYSLIPTSLRKRLLRDFAGMERLPLDSWDKVPRALGIYGIFPSAAVLDDPEAPRYLHQAAKDDLPVYLGKTDRETLMSRILTHAKSVEDARNLKYEWFEMAFVELEDAESCQAGEAIIIQTYGKAPWQGAGFGNKEPGDERSGQTVSEWDTMHPGRGRGEDTAPPEKQRDPEAVHRKWLTKVAKMASRDGRIFVRRVASERVRAANCRANQGVSGRAVQGGDAERVPLRAAA